MTLSSACPLCDGPGGHLVFQGPKFRLIRADEAGFPAFYRLVWTAHVKEFSDLSAAERRECMEAVVLVEQVLRERLQPAKINLASFGNVVPHVHWHVIARFVWDSHFPAPVWDAALRSAPAAEVARVESLRPALEAEMGRRLSAATSNPTAS